MSQHDPGVALRHMLDHAGEAIAMAAGRTRADLDRDRMLNLALVRLVEIVGEAARRVPEPVRAEYPQIPWKQVTGIRSRLIHGYDAVDFDLLWDTVQLDFPVLLSVLRAKHHP